MGDQPPVQEPQQEPDAQDRSARSGWETIGTASASDSNKENRYQKWIDLADAVDAWRPFPRLFISVYIYVVYQTINWFIHLEAPTMEQAGLISVVTGVGAAWFGSYVNSGKKE